jgi:hypothetical protein
LSIGYPCCFIGRALRQTQNASPRGVIRACWRRCGKIETRLSEKRPYHAVSPYILFKAARVVPLLINSKLSVFPLTRNPLRLLKFHKRGRNAPRFALRPR